MMSTICEEGSEYNSLRARIILCFDYNSRLEYVLNNKTESFPNKVESLIEVWKQVSQCQLTEHKQYVGHLMDWLKLHTLNIVLTGDWKKYKDNFEERLLKEVKHCEALLSSSKNVFSFRCRKLAEVIKDPWGNPVLNKMLNDPDVPIGPEEIEFFCIETGYLISTRLRKLCESHCEDLALNLVTTFMRCYQMSETQNFTLNATEDQKRFILDVYIALLFKYKKTAQIISMLKSLSLKEGLELLKRFAHKRVNISKMWRHSVRIAHLAARVYITAAVMKTSEESICILENLLETWLSLNEGTDNLETLMSTIRRIIQAADSAIYMYIFCEVFHKKFGLNMKRFTIELFIRALTTDMNDLERQKNENNIHKISEISKRLAYGFLRLADILDEHVNVSRECVLTSFSLQPTKHTLERIIMLASASGYEVLDTGQEWKCKLHPPISLSDEICWECDLCGDFMSQPDFKTPYNTSTALSEAFTAEQLGLSPQLCDDLVVVLSSPRYQLFNWLLPWPNLYRLCLLYLNDPERTKNLVTELKFVDIDYSMFASVKREPVDEEITGIERGYEHYLEEELYHETQISESGEDSASQESHVYSSGSDGMGDNFNLFFQPTQKSDPNVLKSLRLFRPNLKRSKIDQVESSLPPKVLVTNEDVSPLQTAQTTTSVIHYSNKSQYTEDNCQISDNSYTLKYPKLNNLLSASPYSYSNSNFENWNGLGQAASCSQPYSTHNLNNTNVAYNFLFPDFNSQYHLNNLVTTETDNYSDKALNLCINQKFQNHSQSSKQEINQSNTNVTKNISPHIQYTTTNKLNGKETAKDSIKMFLQTNQGTASNQCIAIDNGLQQLSLNNTDFVPRTLSKYDLHGRNNTDKEITSVKLMPPKKISNAYESTLEPDHATLQCSYLNLYKNFDDTNIDDQLYNATSVVIDKITKLKIRESSINEKNENILAHKYSEQNYLEPPNNFNKTERRKSIICLANERNGNNLNDNSVPVICSKNQFISNAGSVIVEKPVIIEKPLIIEEPLIVKRPVIIEKPVRVEVPITVGKAVMVEKPITVEKAVIVEKPITVGKAVIVENKAGAMKKPVIDNSFSVNTLISKSSYKDDSVGIEEKGKCIVNASQLNNSTSTVCNIGTSVIAQAQSNISVITKVESNASVITQSHLSSSIVTQSPPSNSVIRSAATTCVLTQCQSKLKPYVSIPKNYVSNFTDNLKSNSENTNINIEKSDEFTITQQEVPIPCTKISRTVLVSKKTKNMAYNIMDDIEEDNHRLKKKIIKRYVKESSNSSNDLPISNKIFLRKSQQKRIKSTSQRQKRFVNIKKPSELAEFYKKHKIKEARVVLYRLILKITRRKRSHIVRFSRTSSRHNHKHNQKKGIKKSENKTKKKLAGKFRVSHKSKNGIKSWPLQDKNPKVDHGDLTLCFLNKKFSDPKSDVNMNPCVLLKRLDLDKDKKQFATSVLANVPGLNDLEMIRPSSVDRIVQVVQVPGTRSTTSAPVESSQTSTQITPHIQRIGHPREKSETSDLNSSSTSQTTLTSNSVITTTSESSTLINILNQQIVRPATQTVRSRNSPLINILSHQIIKPATITTTSTKGSSSGSSDVKVNSKPRVITGRNQILNQLINPVNAPTPTLKTVVSSPTAEQNRIVQFVCKSSDGKLIPVTSITSNKVVKVSMTQTLNSSISRNTSGNQSFVKLTQHESKIKKSIIENPDTLPKFQQVFGKSVYQNNDSTECTSSNGDAANADKPSTAAKTQSKSSSTTVNTHSVQGGVIYTRQMPITQAINLIPPGRGQVFRIATSKAEQLSIVKDTVIHSKMSALLAAALQGKQRNSDTEIIIDAEETSQTSGRVTRPTILQNACIVKPVIQIPSTVIRNSPQPNLSSTTLEQLREFDMVYKQVKERSSSTIPSEASPQSDSNESPQISVRYLNQGKKINCTPVVVVSSYCNIQSAASPSLSVTSQGSSSPCVTPAPTTSVPSKTGSKSCKAKSSKNSHPSKGSPIPKPQQKPTEDEHTTQRIFDILAEYAEQLRNSPDLNNKPAPRRRSNPPTNPNPNAKRKKCCNTKKTSHSSNSAPSEGDLDDVHTIGSEDSSCGIVQISLQEEEHPSTTASSSESNERAESPKQVIVTESAPNQPRNVIIADSNGEAIKMSNTAVLVPGNYIMPVSMVKEGQQIAVVSGGNKILATVPSRSGPNMLLFQSFLNQTRKHGVSTVKYSTVQPVSSISKKLSTTTTQTSSNTSPTSQSTTAVTSAQTAIYHKTKHSEHSSISTQDAELLLTISQSSESKHRIRKQDHKVICSNTDTTQNMKPKEKIIFTTKSTTANIHNYEKKSTSVATSVISHSVSTKEKLSEGQSTAKKTIVTVNLTSSEKDKDTTVKVEGRVQSVLVATGTSNGPMLSHNSPPNSKHVDSTNSISESNKDEYLHKEGKVLRVLSHIDDQSLFFNQHICSTVVSEDCIL